MAAFRKAERRQAEARPREPSAKGPARMEEPAQTQEPTRTEGPRRSGRQGVGKRPEEEPTIEIEPRPEEKPSGLAEREAEAPESGSAEDLAPAFRRALSERAQSEPGAAEEVPEEEVPEEEVPEEGGHGREGPPPSPAGSSRPGASYLWVTDRPSDQQGADLRGERSGTVSVEQLSGPRAAEAEAFLLRGGGERPYRLLRRIRGHPKASVYLKPVFWRRGEGERSPVSMHVDGEWTGGEKLDALRERAAEINRRIEAVGEAGEAGEGGVELRVLRFVATRDREFFPRQPEGRGGRFVYPKLTPLLQVESQSSGGELAQILSTAARRIRKRR